MDCNLRIIDVDKSFVSTSNILTLLILSFYQCDSAVKGELPAKLYNQLFSIFKNFNNQRSING